MEVNRGGTWPADVQKGPLVAASSAGHRRRPTEVITITVEASWPNTDSRRQALARRVSAPLDDGGLTKFLVPVRGFEPRSRG